MNDAKDLYGIDVTPPMFPAGTLRFTGCPEILDELWEQGDEVTLEFVFDNANQTTNP